MSDRGWRGRDAPASALPLVAVAALAVSGSAFGGAAQACGNVTLNEHSWAGSTANTYVAKYVLEKRLGCTVKITNVTEGPPYFQAMARRQGRRRARGLGQHARPRRRRTYIKDKSVRVVGTNGITGVIGWYIPRYLLKQYPQFKTWRGLKGKEALFKSPESGSQGMFLGGDPSYVQKDRALIKELGLNLKHVVAGAEPAQVARWSQLYKQSKPVLFYWYDPQYLNAQYDLVRVKLPKRFKGCLDDEKAGPGSTRASTRRTGSTSSSRESSRRAARRALQVHPEVELDVGRPELRRQPHRRQEDEAGQGGGAVGEGERGQGQRLAEVS